MLSNTKCKQILNKNGVYYTDEEIVLIKQTLYKLAEIMLRQPYSVTETKSVPLKTSLNVEVASQIKP